MKTAIAESKQEAEKVNRADIPSPPKYYTFATAMFPTLDEKNCSINLDPDTKTSVPINANRFIFNL